MKKTLAILITFLSLNSARSQTIYQKDFAYYLQTVENNFAYFNTQHADWNKVKTVYRPEADTITSRASLIRLLEKVNNELYNGHVFLNTNTQASNRLIPSGADLKVSRINNKFIITEIREGFNADECGLTRGMIVTKFNGQDIETAIKKYLPRSVSSYDNAMYEYAANMLLAGTHDTKREITAYSKGAPQVFRPDEKHNRTEENYETLLDVKIMQGNIGYIKINNSLGNSDLAAAFDRAVDSLMNTKGMILDLRETAGGGTSTEARAIMSRFISKELPYQKHIYTAEEKETGIRRSTLEFVTPRKTTYTKKLVVLVGYWTGSMGEGIAIGFDGIKRGMVIGTKMAGLLGEIYSFETPETKIPFSFPCVQLQHVNGQPRENFLPSVIINDSERLMKAAMEKLK